MAVLALAAAVVATLAVVMAPAQAQSPDDPSFNCRASAVRLTLGTAPIEPLRANNPFNPCEDEAVGANTLGVPNANSPVVITDDAQARTDILCKNVPVDLAGTGTPPNSDQCDNERPFLQQGVARAQAANVRINLGSQGSQTNIVVAAARSAAKVVCDTNNRPVFSSFSQLVSLTVNGEGIELPRPNEEATLNLGLVKIVVNERIGTEGPQSGAFGGLIRRALHVTVPANGRLIDLVVAESVVGFDQVDACTPSPGSTGGRIVPLSQVPGHRGSPCRGPGFGPLFAILGTNGRDRITGSNFADRIFALGGRDDVSGGRGNDCIEGDSGNDNLDGSNGRDTIIGGTGKDRIAGGPSNDRLRGSSGRDRLSGGTGNDRLNGGGSRDKIRGGDGNDRMLGGSGNDGIHTGNGRDRVNAGRGNDVVNAATRGPAARVNCGPGKDRARINNNERRRTRNCEFIDVFRRIRRG